MALADDLDRLETAIRQLQVKWDLFFSGAEKKPPVDFQTQVEQLVRRYANQEIRNNGERFRYQGLTARYTTFNELWQKRLLGGYELDPATALGEGFEDPRADLVVVRGIAVHGVCPHHLVPFRGVAHVAYLPGGRLHGFGRIARLVDAIGHRLSTSREISVRGPPHFASGSAVGTSPRWLGSSR